MKNYENGGLIEDNELHVFVVPPNRGSIRFVKGGHQGVKLEPVGGKC